jgi:hypothetical protein
MKKAITKASIKKIIDTYSVRKDEFELISELSLSYKSKITRNYLIKIEPDEAGKRIFVYHSNGKGKRQFIDTWENGNNGLEWLYRNSANEPLSDVKTIESYQKEMAEVEKVKAAARELMEQTKREKAEYEDQIEMLKAEIENLKKSRIVYDTAKESNKQGRPKETERMKADASKIKELMESGKTNDEIMDILKLKRATFFRLKRLIQQM